MSNCDCIVERRGGCGGGRDRCVERGKTDGYEDERGEREERERCGREDRRRRGWEEERMLLASTPPLSSIVLYMKSRWWGLKLLIRMTLRERQAAR